MARRQQDKLKSFGWFSSFDLIWLDQQQINFLKNNQISPGLIQLQYFECYHMLIDHFLLIDQKSFVHQL